MKLLTISSELGAYNGFKLLFDLMKSSVVNFPLFQKLVLEMGYFDTKLPVCTNSKKVDKKSWQASY